MGQEASAGIAGAGLASANQMTNLYGQGAQTLATVYQNQATGLGNSAYVKGGAQAGVWGNVGNIGGAMLQNYLNQNLYQSAPRVPAASMPRQTYGPTMGSIQAQATPFFGMR